MKNEEMKTIRVAARAVDFCGIDYGNSLVKLSTRRDSPTGKTLEAAANLGQVTPGGLLWNLEIEQDDGSVWSVGPGAFTWFELHGDDMTHRFQFLDTPRLRTPPKDIIRASIQGGTILIEREEMERVKALGVDIREVHTQAFRYSRAEVEEARAEAEEVRERLARQEIHGEWRPDRQAKPYGEVLAHEPEGLSETEWRKVIAAVSPCPDCKGSGEYVGLAFERGPCKTCQGGE